MGMGGNRWEQVGTGVKNFDQVLIATLRRSYQNRCEVLFFLEGQLHASEIWFRTHLCWQMILCSFSK